MTMMATSPGTAPMREADERLASACCQANTRYRRQQNKVGPDQKRQAGDEPRSRARAASARAPPRASIPRRPAHPTSGTIRCVRNTGDASRTAPRERTDGPAAGRFPAEQIGEPHQRGPRATGTTKNGPFSPSTPSEHRHHHRQTRPGRLGRSCRRRKRPVAERRKHPLAVRPRKVLHPRLLDSAEVRRATGGLADISIGVGSRGGKAAVMHPEVQRDADGDRHRATAAPRAAHP